MSAPRSAAGSVPSEGQGRGEQGGAFMPYHRENSRAGRENRRGRSSRAKGKSALDLRESSLPMFGLLDDVVDRTQTPCSVCGYEKLRVPDVLRIAVPTSAEVSTIFRAANAPTVLFSTERFVNIVHERGLQGLNFTAIEVRHLA
jgi:hypothetical protein